MKRLILKIKKKFSIDTGEKISRSERYTTMAALGLMQIPDTELLIHPTKDRYYIHAGNDQYLIIINIYPATVTLINHKLSHDVKYSRRAMDFLQNKFLEVTEKRRDKFEKKFLDNTENSLRSVALSIMNLK